MTLEADEFIRRFLKHAVPGGFHRIRQIGFLATLYRAEKLARCWVIPRYATASDHRVDDRHRECRMAPRSEARPGHLEQSPSARYRICSRRFADGQQLAQ